MFRRWSLVPHDVVQFGDRASAMIGELETDVDHRTRAKLCLDPTGPLNEMLA